MNWLKKTGKELASVSATITLRSLSLPDEGVKMQGREGGGYSKWYPNHPKFRLLIYANTLQFGGGVCRRSWSQNSCNTIVFILSFKDLNFEKHMVQNISMTIILEDTAEHYTCSST